MRSESNSLKRKKEASYWARLMSDGLTLEQAREKVYQGLIEKGDLKGAKVMREFQIRL